MSECRYISTVIQWNGILIEYTTIRNNEELIKFTMRNLVGLDDHALIHLFSKLRPFFSPFNTAVLDKPGQTMVLTDLHQNELHLRGCRWGSSPGTEAAFAILQQSGFHISRALLRKARSFYLEKPALKISFN